MKTEGRCIPDVLLHRYLTAVLEGEARERVEKLLAESESDRARLEELRAEAREFLVSHPPAPLVVYVERAVGERKRRRWWWRGAFAAPVLTGLAALTLVLVRPEGPPPDETGWVAKGGGVQLRVQRQAGSVWVERTDMLAPGDLIRFEVQSTTPGYLAVVGQDATGKVRVYHSKETREPVPIPEGQTELPPFPLSETLGDEEVNAFFSPTPFELAPVLRAFEEGRSVVEVLPLGIEVTSLQLRKQREP